MLSLPDLYTCLQQTTWRHLLAIARVHGLAASTRTRKATLVHNLNLYLSCPDTLKEIVRRLDNHARHALRTLLDANGSLPVHLFQAHFGPLRPYRPWTRDHTGQPPPWENPASTTERLWYLGLIFQTAAHSPTETLPCYSIPSNFIQPLQAALFHPLTGQPLEQCPSHTSLDRDLALLLAWCQGHAVHAVHDRWLPPTALRAIGHRIGPPVISEQELQRRSERHIPYLAFLHHLTDAAGLLRTLFGLLKPTPAAWQWAAKDTLSRLHTLYKAWLDQSPEAIQRWRVYSLPFAWHRDPVVLARSVLNTLRWPELHGWHPAHRLWEQWWARSGLPLLRGYTPEDEGQAAFLDFLQGPCVWVGLVRLASDADGQLYLQRTPQGDWLLGLPDSSPPPLDDPQPCRWRPDGTILIPPTASPLHLLRLASYAQWDDTPTRDGSQRLQLTEATIATAVAAGFPLAMIREHLETACAQPLSRRWWTRLRRWAALANRYRIRRLTVLEANDPQALAPLRRYPALRRCLGEPLSPRTIQVKPDRLPQLLRGLRRLGAYPRVELPPAETTVKRAPLPQSALLWLAAEVYRRLGEHLPLPIPLPTEILDAIATGLSDAEREAAAAYADQILGDLMRLIEGYLQYPAGERRSDPRQIRLLIEEAMAQGQDLEIVYWSASRGQQTVRCVTPYWIEEEGNALYLIAYCHARQAQRVFRLDRIETARILGENTASTDQSPNGS